MKDFKGLKVWQKAHNIFLAIYKLTLRFPKEELYGLTSQIRRAAVSIAANIAEGCGRRSDGELHRFLQIARGSASGLEYHLLLAHDLTLLPTEDFKRLETQLVEVQRMLTSFSATIKQVGASS